jgi:hypothetical protein
VSNDNFTFKNREIPQVNEETKKFELISELEITPGPVEGSVKPNTWTWAMLPAVIAGAMYKNRKVIIKGVMFLCLFHVAMSSLQNPKTEVVMDEELKAEAQAKGKVKVGRGGWKTRVRTNKGARKFHVPSGGAEPPEGDMEGYISRDELDEVEPDYEYPEYDSLQESYDTRRYVPDRDFEKARDKRMNNRFEALEGQGRVHIPVKGPVLVEKVTKRPILPPARKPNEPLLQNKIRTSKKPVSANKKDILGFLVDAADKQKKAMAHFKAKPQSFEPNALAAGVYRWYRVEGDKMTYLCTATHVGNKMIVVLHSLSEDVSVKYRAINHVHTFDFKGSDVNVYGEHLAWFPVSGHPSPFKGTTMKVLEDAQIVSVFGYGNGQKTAPDVVTGFASPLGWCNARTRDGDCTSPVLDSDGKIVGFWTHGNGIDFGRFEPVTSEFIAIVKNGPNPEHVGLDFLNRPHSL